MFSGHCRIGEWRINQVSFITKEKSELSIDLSRVANATLSVVKNMKQKAVNATFEVFV